MDSTPTPTPTPHHTIQAIKSSSVSKLPIKRKSQITTPLSPPPPPPFPTPPTAVDGSGSEAKPPPFKFHRIWTEPDEIRFLQGLLESASDNLVFPRDLNLFYSKFSNTMSQPYTKSQLSEKLRRLRKKFRVVSTRVSKGLDPTLLSPHDQSLYHLSKQLWHPLFNSSSPFNSNSNNNSVVGNDNVDSLDAKPVNDSGFSEVKIADYVVEKAKISSISGFEIDDFDVEKKKGSGLVGVSIDPLPMVGSDHTINCENKQLFGYEDNGDVRLREVNVELDEGIGEEELVGPSGVDGVSVVGKVVMEVFDNCLKEVKIDSKVGNGSSLKGFEERWQEQRVAELDVLRQRMLLVLEDSLQMHW